ncbi:MAG: Mov34/MPN/PAD-1 family protein [Candidatus Kariarchaeaceae archaeon]|jgi:proteasome lid subunit RPN8/RPN11
MLNISNEEIEKIKAHGEETFPEECCGVIIANTNNLQYIIESRPMRNTNAGSRNTRYNIDPLDLIKLEDELDRKNQTMLGIYHSHPNHPAKPSKFDLEHAWPNLSYIVLSVKDGKSIECTAWRLDKTRTSFEEESINICEE